MTAPADGTALYRIRGEGAVLLYIGISDDFGRRWKEHAKQQPWWPEKRTLSVDEWFGSRADAEEAEEAAIKAEGPKYNIVHARSGERARRRDAFASVMPPGETRETAEVVIPRILQTYAYAENREVELAKLRKLPPDYGRSIALARMHEQAALYDARHRFDFVLSEAVLRLLTAPRQIMLGQLERLLNVMSLENVTIRIAAFGVQTPRVWTFIVTEGPVLRVPMDFGADQVERGLAAERSARHYDWLTATAATGEKAQQLIMAAAAHLQDGQPADTNVPAPRRADAKGKRRAPEGIDTLF